MEGPNFSRTRWRSSPRVGLFAIGSPEELIDRHANYLCVTLKAADVSVHGIMRGMGIEPVHDDSGGITIHIEHTSDVQAILTAIAAASTPLPGLDVRKPSLEEVFLALTGRNRRARSAMVGVST